MDEESRKKLKEILKVLDSVYLAVVNDEEPDVNEFADALKALDKIIGDENG